MQDRWPREKVLWKNQVEHMLQGLRVDYDRLWKNLPQIPDPEMGLPFTGPLVPVPFCFPPCEVVGTGGTPNTGGTRPSGTAGGANCPGAKFYDFTFAATNGTCFFANCPNINGSYTLQYGGSSPCRWNDVGVLPGLCGTPAGGSSFQLVYISVPVRTQLVLGVVGINATWTMFTTPPVAGESKTLSLTATDGVCNWPATVLITGRDT